jgi:thiol-disulfide isomerase/thioredoxin
LTFETEKLKNIIYAFFVFVFCLCASPKMHAQKTIKQQEELLKNMEDFLTFSTKKWVGKSFPNFSGVSITGDTLNNQKLKGKWVFINFWFANCPPCRAEIRALKRLYTKYKDSVEFIAVTYETPTVIKAFRDKEKFFFTHISMPQKSIDSLQIVSAYPTSVLLGKNGKIIAATSGGYVDENMNVLYMLRKWGEAIEGRKFK